MCVKEREREKMNKGSNRERETHFFYLVVRPLIGVGELLKIYGASLRDLEQNESGQ